MERVHVGLVGSQFISAIHFAALESVAAAEVVAVASPTAGHARTFAEDLNTFTFVMVSQTTTNW